MPDLTKQTLTIDELAEIFSCSRSHIRRGWYSGQIPAPIRVGRRAIRWRLDDILAFLKSQQGLEAPEHPQTEYSL